MPILEDVNMNAVFPLETLTSLVCCKLLGDDRDFPRGRVRILTTNSEGSDECGNWVKLSTLKSTRTYRKHSIRDRSIFVP